MTIQGSKLFGNTWVAPTLTVDDEGVTVVNPGTYGLIPVKTLVPFAQIASVEVKRGLFSCDVIIETAGGKKASIRAVSADDADRVSDFIQERMRGR